MGSTNSPKLYGKLCVCVSLCVTVCTCALDREPISVTKFPKGSLIPKSLEPPPSEYLSNFCVFIIIFVMLTQYVY